VGDEFAYFTLRVTEPGATPRSVRLDDGAVAVGRSQRDNAVVVSDHRVSLHHAEFLVAGAAVRVRDLASTNGTWVRRLESGELAAPHQLHGNVPLALSPGDEVRLGDPAGPSLTLELEPVFLDRIKGPLALSLPDDPPRVHFLERLFRRMDLAGLLDALVSIVLEAFAEPENVTIWGAESEVPLVQARRRERLGFLRTSSTLPFSRTVLAHVRSTADMVVFGTPLPQDLDVASLRAARIVAGFCAPLVDGSGKVVGVIQADGRSRAFVPDRAQMEEVARLGRAAGSFFSIAFAADEARRSALALEREAASLRRELGDRMRLQGIVGRHPALARQLELASRVSALAAPVLILGETGTGKDLFARAIHAASPRAKAPFVAINCAELPPSLAESELFGHEKGAFTGADRPNPGLFERAHGGSLFLDEVGEASLALQTMLLRVIERNEIRRIGARETRSVDVRVIAATNRDLEAEVARGAFRRDLFFRLNVVPLYLPPLRERREDIPELVEHVLAELRPRLGRPGLRVHQDALEALVLDPWPGNVRELENRLLRASILTPSDDIHAEHVRPPGQEGPPAAQALDRALGLLPLKEARDEFVRQHVRRALEVSRGNRKDAARLLQVDPSNLSRTMRRLGLAPPGETPAGEAADDSPDGD
jgi:transcriptional regulator with GAF, ATPase, and Fis domain